MALTIGDNFSYKGSKPLDARLKYDTLAAMKAVADSELYEGILAYCVGADKTYQWKSTNTVDAELGKWREFTSGGEEGQKIQVDTMPSAGADEVGHIYEYTGDTTSSFVNGRFYKCVTDGTTYEWAEVLMNDNETQEISKADFDALPQSEKDNGTAYFIPDATAVSNLTVMGNRFDKANIYTEDERMVGSWLGKPLYQKTFEVTLPNGVNTEQDVTVDCTNLNIEQAVTAFLCHDGTDINTGAIGYFYPLPASASLMVWYNNSNKKIYVRRKAVSATAVGGGSTGFVTIQYTKTTDGEVKIGAPNDFSTDEMIVGTWIDGKPVYRRVLSGDSLPAQGTVLLTDVDSVINAYGRQFYTPGPCWFHFPYMLGNTEIRWEHYTTNNTVRFRLANTSNTTKYVYIFEYTKTTD